MGVRNLLGRLIDRLFVRPPGPQVHDFDPGYSYGTDFDPVGDDNAGWGVGWVEITVFGDEFRRFQKPDGKIVEVPFGEHTDEEEETDGEL